MGHRAAAEYAVPPLSCAGVYGNACRRRKLNRHIGRRMDSRGAMSLGEGAAELEGNVAMWRSFFLALGAYCCLLGVEALAIEKAVVKIDSGSPGQSAGWREVVPPDWAPWSMMAGGAIVMLYSFTIPQRVHGSG
jgi:hypothetical protein